MHLGPGMPRHYYAKDTTVEWKWPVPEHWDKPGSPELKKELEDWDESIPLLPRAWPILREVSREESERRDAGGPEMKPEDEPGRGRIKHMQDESQGRGWTLGDKSIVSQALQGLDDENNDHWTKSGIPQVDAVRQGIENIEMKFTQERRWPSWATREIIDSVGGRKRGDFDAEAAALRDAGVELEDVEEEVDDGGTDEHGRK